MKKKRGSPIKDIVGKRFGKLTVIGLAGRSANRQTRWNCICDCGKEKVIVRSSLASGHSKSCGCLHSTVGGEASNSKRTKEYAAWAGMKARCHQPNDHRYSDYGGRGIIVCEKWRNDYNAFLKDVGRSPTRKHSIDRINVNGNYEPENVRWATAKQQHHNRRDFQRKGWRQAAKHAYRVVADFEMVLASYTGAKYAVAVESCTSAILIACAYLKVKRVDIPKLTYPGVPMSVIHAGGKVRFTDEKWVGMYQLKPYPIYDSARLMTSNMYIPGSLMCLSFHWTKHLPIGRGGAILCDNMEAVEWLKRARFDGRKEGVDPKNDAGLILGWHMYLTPAQAAQGLNLMANMKEHNDPLPNSEYPDLSMQEVFK